MRLFLEGGWAGLVLHLPAKWRVDRGAFDDTGACTWQANPGRVANDLHRQFSAAVGADTLRQVEAARRGGAVLYDHRGFHARNLQVARSSYLIAYTFSDGAAPPAQGGTRHTWSHCAGRRIHRPISSLERASRDADGAPRPVPSRSGTKAAARQASIASFFPVSKRRKDLE